MPFIRYTRDKRGYETTYLLHGFRPAQASASTRVLYLFRSPAHMKVGRRALDEEAREALTHMHPDLTFDWIALGQGSAEARHEERREEFDRSARPKRHAPPAPAPAPRAPIVDDQSLLGRTLGAAEAARLRGRYGELLGRIARRARTPEERDRLSERAQRLNPDDWPDETSIRTARPTVETEWEALVAELPQRRRGRRGGRRSPDGSDRPAGFRASGPADASSTVGVSGIIAEPGDPNARAHFAEDPRPDRLAGAPGDRDALGPEQDPDAGPAGSGLPGDE